MSFDSWESFTSGKNAQEARKKFEDDLKKRNADAKAARAKAEKRRNEHEAFAAEVSEEYEKKLKGQDVQAGRQLAPLNRGNASALARGYSAPNNPAPGAAPPVLTGAHTGPNPPAGSSFGSPLKRF